MSLINGDTQSRNRPGCWGRTDIYDSENRECRGCGFQSTCQNQVIKTIQSAQPTVPQVSQSHSPYSPFQHQPQQYSIPQSAFRVPTPAPFSPPVPSYVPQAPLPAPYAVPTRIPVVPPAPMPQMHAAQMQPQMTQMPTQMPMTGAQDFYGRVQDPLFFPVMNAPPFRPQLPGETFGERFLKNLFLDLGTMAAFHVGLALRQMILPPQPKLPDEKIINPLK